MPPLAPVAVACAFLLLSGYGAVAGEEPPADRDQVTGCPRDVRIVAYEAWKSASSGTLESAFRHEEPYVPEGEELEDLRNTQLDGGNFTSRPVVHHVGCTDDPTFGWLIEGRLHVFYGPSEPYGHWWS